MSEQTIKTLSEWQQATVHAHNIGLSDHGLMLETAGRGTWTSSWQQGPYRSSNVLVTVDAHIDLFAHQTIEKVVDGSGTPFTDADQVPHTWYGRCMIAILDANRWIMALRSGIGHVNWGTRDAIHLVTSNDQGKTWGGLNRWFDGSRIDGVPYEDGHTHSEPGLYRMPNGELILQFWRTSFTSGTKQLRSTDAGKTWQLDVDQICVEGVPGAASDRVLGCQDFFIDPENTSHIYMAFEYFHYDHKAGSILARSTDNCRTYQFISWIGSLAIEKTAPDSGAAFEPAIEYVGDRTIVAILRDASGNRFTWQSVSTDMGQTFGELEDISAQVNGGAVNGLWQRARLYKESNPCFQYDNRLNYSKGEGRLWGFGIHSIGGGYTRKPVVYWSDNHGKSWCGPQLLHGPMAPGTDTGYGDLKRRTDHRFVADTYYVDPAAIHRPDKPADQKDDAAAVDPTSTGKTTRVSDVEQYTFGGQRARLKVEFEGEGGSTPDSDANEYELYDGANEVTIDIPAGRRWRLVFELSADGQTPRPSIRGVRSQNHPHQREA